MTTSSWNILSGSKTMHYYIVPVLAVDTGRNNHGGPVKANIFIDKCMLNSMY